MKNIPNIKSILAVLGGVGAGLGIMYLFDPDKGSARRAAIRDRAEEIRDRAAEMSNDVRTSVYSAGSEFVDRAQEVIRDTTAMIPLVSSSAGQAASVGGSQAKAVPPRIVPPRAARRDLRRAN